METTDIVILEWTFSPPDYFEDRINIKRNDYEMVIDRGKAEARIKPELYDKNPSMKDDLHRALNDRFRGVQILTHKPYNLLKASMYRLHPDGHKDITIFAEPIVSTMSLEIDMIIKDKYGNVVSDSRKERVEKKRELADLTEKYCRSDPTAACILKSYHAAVNDPNNELVHLYEIRDALSKRFKGKNKSCKALNINKDKKWSRLGILANTEPLKQGRHRGQNPGSLRDATEAELMEARNIARNLIESYLKYLEKLSEGVP